MRALSRLLGFALGIILLTVSAGLVVAMGLFAVDRLATAPGPATETTSVVVERGSGVRHIAEELTNAGVIGNPWVFKLHVRLEGVEDGLTAGAYAFPAGASVMEVVRMLREHEIVQYRVTLVEGWTVRQAFDALAAEPALTGALPEPPAQGSLLPDTYFFDRGDTRAEVVERMHAAMRDELAAAWAERAPDVPLANPEEALVLASIVEKETSVDAERAVVAGVFVNRLRRGMPLQTDPTVIYALTKGEAPLGRPLRRADLGVDDPYNTYRYRGLPPGPIANPGRASNRAALQPAETPYLYFVADGTGGHAFARTLEEHNANVRNWRRVQQQRDG